MQVRRLKTGVEVSQKANRIEVDSPYWTENRKPKNYELADFAIVALWVLILTAILWS